MAFARRHLSFSLPPVLFFALLATSLGAAPAGADRVFSVLAAGEADWTDFGLIEGERFTPIQPGRQRRSPELALSGGAGAVVFGRRGVDPATGRPRHVPLARAEWPEGAERALFVLMPRAEASEIEVMACDDGAEKFPAQSLRVMNATAATFEGVIGRERLALAPGASAPVGTAEFIPPDEDAPDPGMPVGLALATPQGVKTLYAANLSVGARARVLILIAPPRRAGSMRLQVRAIHETAPAPDAESTARD